MHPLQVAFSPCPNDTFIFHAWAAGLIPEAPSMQPVFGDIECLNRWALKGRYPVSKVSVGCLPLLLDTHDLLPVGAALGYNCGPLVVSENPSSLEDLAHKTIAIPGEHTSAHQLFKLFAPEDHLPHFCLYHEVVDKVMSGEVNAGVIIHETRFLYEVKGLQLVADLGKLWETRFEMPVPLGCVVARKDVKDREGITGAIHASLQAALEDPTRCEDFVLAHSQELDRQTVRSHIEMFVTAESLGLSEKAIKAINLLVDFSGATKQ